MNAITIADISIRNSENLYNLNDLHRASGELSRHKPSNWLRSQQTSELINELILSQMQDTHNSENSSDAHFRASELKQRVINVLKGGLKQGTYVCRELALAYATWISPKFFLLVIRTFDEVMNKQTQSAKINEFQKQQIKDAVNKRHRRTEETHQAIYTKLHQFIGVNSYHEIPANRFQDALQFIGSTVDTPSKPSNHITVHLPAGNNRWLITVDSKGHQVMQADSLLENSLTVTEQEVQDIAVSACNMQRMSLVYEHLYPALSILKSRFSVQAEAFSTDYFSHSIALTRIVNRLRPQLSARSQYEIGSTMSGML